MPLPKEFRGFKPLASEATRVFASPPSRAACAGNRVHSVMRAAHLQVLHLGDIRQAPAVDPPPPCRPARGAPTAAQPSPEYPRTSPPLRKAYHIHAQAPRLQTTVGEAYESQTRAERTTWLLHVPHTQASGAPSPRFSHSALANAMLSASKQLVRTREDELTFLK